jgi:hypothetical protein
MDEGTQSRSNSRAGKYYYRMLAARVIETEQWELADQFPLPDGWKPKSFSLAGYYFARGFAAAMNGEIKEANKYLNEIQMSLRSKRFCWKKNCPHLPARHVSLSPLMNYLGKFI